MKYFIEVLDDNYQVIKRFKTTFSSLRKAMSYIYDLSVRNRALRNRGLRGNYQVKRNDGAIYELFIFDNGVNAIRASTGKFYSY